MWVESGYDEFRSFGENKLDLFIPKDKAGGLIGHAGSRLKDLMHDTGCKIHVAKEETNGMRKVSVWHDDAQVLEIAKEKILAVAATVASNYDGDGR